MGLRGIHAIIAKMPLFFVKVNTLHFSLHMHVDLMIQSFQKVQVLHANSN